LRDNFDLEKGIISTEDIIMREDKDMTEAEATSRIAKNQVGVQNVSQVESQE